MDLIGATTTFSGWRRKPTTPFDFYGGTDVPPFLKTLNRLFNSRVWEKDYNIYEQAHRERLMMLSWYLGSQLKMSEEEIRSMLEKSAKWPSP